MDKVECEPTCVFFEALTHINESAVRINRAARKAVNDHQEFPGSAATMCGGCAQTKNNEAALYEKMYQPLLPNEVIRLPVKTLDLQTV